MARVNTRVIAVSNVQEFQSENGFESRYLQLHTVEVSRKATLEKKLRATTLLVITSTLAIACKLKVIPFKYIKSADKDSIEIRTIQTSLLWFHLNAILIYLYTIYTVVAFFDNTSKFGTQLAVHIMKLLVISTAAAQLFTYTLNPDCAVAMMNSNDCLRKRSQRQGYNIPNWWESAAAWIPLVVVEFQSTAVPLMLASTCVLFPTSSMFVGSLLPREIVHNYFVRVLLGIYEFYTAYACFLVDMTTVILACGYFVNVLQWLPKLRCGDVTISLKETRQKGLRTNFKTYTYLYLLTNYFNGFYYHLISIMVFGLCGFTTLCIYVCITGYEILEIHVYIMFSIITIIMLCVICVMFAQIGYIKVLSTLTVRALKAQVYLEKHKELKKEFKMVTSASKVAFQTNVRTAGSLRPFGSRLLTIYCTLKTPLRMMEQVFSCLIVILELELHK